MAMESCERVVPCLAESVPAIISKPSPSSIAEPKPKPPRILCAWCMAKKKELKFTAANGKKKFCSNSCLDQYKKIRYDELCVYCSNDLPSQKEDVVSAQIRGKQMSFCCVECAQIYSNYTEQQSHFLCDRKRRKPDRPKTPTNLQINAVAPKSKKLMRNSVNNNKSPSPEVPLEPAGSEVESPVPSVTDFGDEDPRLPAEVAITPSSPPAPNPCCAILAQYTELHIDFTQPLPSDPLDWTRTQVVQYLMEVDPSLAPCAPSFYNNDIDGKALLLLTSPIMVAYMKLNRNHAEKIEKLIIRLLAKHPLPY